MRIQKPMVAEIQQRQYCESRHYRYSVMVFSPTKKQSLLTWKKTLTQSGMERETWEASNQLLKELSIFGWLRFHETLCGALQPDRHEGEFEIHYLKRGHLNWWVEDTTYEFRPGSVYVIRPGQLHGGDEESLQPCEHVWFRIRFNAEPLPGLTEKESADLQKGMEALRHTTFPVSTAVGDFLDRLLIEHRTRGENSVMIARGLLHALLVTILRDYTAFTTQSQGTPLITWRIRRALEILDTDSSDSAPRVAELAEKIGLSESGFRERFKAEMGFSPHEYILNKRITQARRMLTETDFDITRVAIDLGFSSSQYFATVFRRQVGMSPGEYRKRHKES